MLGLFARRGTSGAGRAGVGGAGEGRPSPLAPELAARVRQVQIRTHRLVNTALSGGYRSTFRGAGVEFQEVRAYQPGDDVRSIDWNVTARHQVAYVKVFAEERQLTLNLLVDTSRSMDFGSRGATKREAAAQLCALLSFVAIRHQDRVGLSLFGERPGLHLPARKGNQHVLRVVREVLAAPTTPGRSDLAGVLEEQVRVLRRRSVVFLVSDFLDPDADAAAGARPPAWVDVLARLNRRHDVIAVRVFDPLEQELPAAGLLDVSELETGRRAELDTRSRAVREAWAERARRRRERLVEHLARARVDRIDVDASGNVADPVIAFFRRRQARHGGRG